jgi:hypothetical protein
MNLSVTEQMQPKTSGKTRRKLHLWKRREHSKISSDPIFCPVQPPCLTVAPNLLIMLVADSHREYPFLPSGLVYMIKVIRTLSR